MAQLRKSDAATRVDIWESCLVERKERIEGMGTLYNILPSVVADHPFSFLAARRRHPVRSFSPLFLSGLLKKGHGASVLPSVLPTVDHPTPPQNPPPTPTILPPSHFHACLPLWHQLRGWRRGEACLSLNDTVSLPPRAPFCWHFWPLFEVEEEDGQKQRKIVE